METGKFYWIMQRAYGTWEVAQFSDGLQKGFRTINGWVLLANVYQVHKEAIKKPN